VSLNRFDSLLQDLRIIALDAGQAILEVYESDEVKIAEKDDKSPVTEADTRAEGVILEGLARALPGCPVISEEAVAAGAEVTRHERFILVDPLDGTREFIKRNGEFTVNIALIENGIAVAGIVFAPAIGKLFTGADGRAVAQTADPLDVLRRGHAAALSAPKPIEARVAPAQMVAVASRSHRDHETDKFLSARGITEVVSAGSSLKFCLVASGEADIYPRFGTTMEWDTAAGQAVLEAAGGSVCEASGARLRYGKFDARLTNPHFIARGRKA
jgi:3'(2'), 5'-bisphosphate nucleotidase